MTVGLADRFNILEQSPHDLTPSEGESRVLPESSENYWVPSRYNVRATTEDGRLVLWNSFRGSFSIFGSAQRERILPMIRKPGIRAEATGLVEYLVERGYLIRKGTNEHRRLQMAFGQKHFQNDILELILMSSEDCNFRCQYCYEEFARGTMEPWVRTALKKLVTHRAENLQTLRISWFGGEPLYGWPAIEDLGPFFDETARSQGLFYRSHMTTNGYLLTRAIVDKLLSWRVTSYQITIDGCKEDHDHNRPTRNGQGTFDTIFGNLQDMQRRSEEYQVTLRVNYDKNNHGRVDRFLELVEVHLGRDSRFHLDFHPVGRWGGPNDQNVAECGVDQSRKVSLELKRAAHERGLRFSGILKDVRVGSQVCYAARPYSLLIGATGKVMKCTVALDMKDYNVVGQLHENGELELDTDKFALWTEPAFENDKQCQKCVIVPSCQGMFCPMDRFEDKVSPCPSTRLHLKDEMLQAVEFAEAGRSKRKLEVR